MNKPVAPYKGKFITLEGGEGAGKSTQTRAIATYLQNHGIQCVVTREVGGPPTAEVIRQFWLAAPEGPWDSLTEVLLINAARREHLIKTVWPALQKGIWVISDRYVDSTRAYQGICLDVGLDTINQFHDHVCGGFEADKTFLLDLNPREGLTRVARRAGETDRYENKDIAFHEKLRGAYHQLEKTGGGRIIKINAEQVPENVSTDIAMYLRDVVPQ
jgi:dTMP kinase